jgi:AcrR family transcriptional regulator
VVDETRDRILKVALDLFSEQGYYATSIREIAERLGLTKTAVLYHFPSKKELVTALTQPLLADMDAIIQRATSYSGPELDRNRWELMEGLLDVWLSHRHLLRMGLHDLALAAEGPVFERFRDAMALATHVVAGRVPDATARIRAIQMLGMLSDPVVIYADMPTQWLRATVLAGVRLVFEAAPARSPDGGHKTRRGRPSALTPELVETALRLRATGRYTAAQLAAELGVSRATLFRHLPPSE